MHARSHLRMHTHKGPSGPYIKLNFFLSLEGQFLQIWLKLELVVDRSHWGGQSLKLHLSPCWHRTHTKQRPVSIWLSDWGGQLLKHVSDYDWKCLSPCKLVQNTNDWECAMHNTHNPRGSVWLNDWSGKSLKHQPSFSLLVQHTQSKGQCTIALAWLVTVFCCCSCCFDTVFKLWVKLWNLLLKPECMITHCWC